MAITAIIVAFAPAAAADQYDLAWAGTSMAVAAPSPPGGRPAGCPPRRWCGCALAVRIFGEPRRDLWLARNWLRLGRELTGPRVGAIVVFARGRNGGHVGQIVEVMSPTQIRIWSGNDRGQIRESLRSTVGVIGYRDIFGAQ
jgi:hypothetical protein